MDDLRDLATQARTRAHAPYSKFHVGVAIETASGQRYVGANMENASYPEGWCAETSALAHMQMAEPGARVARVYVLGQGEGILTPCGGCRQRLAEFGDADTEVICANLDGLSKRFTLSELLPAAFDLNPADAPD